MSRRPDGQWLSTRRRAPSAAVMFAGNLVLALVWMAMTARFDLSNLALGMAFGYLVLYASQVAVGRSAYFGRPLRLVRFVGFYALEVVRANVRVAFDVATPTSMARPGIVAIPLEARSDTEILLLSSLISMTPGSLTLDISDDRRVVYVHAMFLDDPDAFRRDIKEELERRVLELTR
jgi:multicomponent Na+:H+ antiporter subunit E